MDNATFNDKIKNEKSPLEFYKLKPEILERLGIKDKPLKKVVKKKEEETPEEEVKADGD
jgi:hypothetical protein